MIKKFNNKEKDSYLFFILLFMSLFLSNTGILGITDSRIMPNYFIALVIAFIITNKANLNLFLIVLQGIIKLSYFFSI